MAEKVPNNESSRFDRTIVEGPLGRAVWKIAWPTMLTNVIAGLQGLVDHIVVGNVIGYKANAAIGVSWQIFLVVIVFISSLFSGMSVLVARYTGAGEELKVDRTVYQAFLTAMIISVGILAPFGYFASPFLLDLVNAESGVKAEALPYLRITFVFSLGLLIYFMLSGALRSAGDAKTPMVLGIIMTALNLVLNIIFIRGLGPIPSFGTAGAAIGTSVATYLIGSYALWRLFFGGWVVRFPKGMSYRPDLKIIRNIFKFGLPTGFQGVAMNMGGVLILAFIGSLEQSAAAQAAFAVGYSQLFSLITWTAVGLMGATAAVAGQNLGAGKPERSVAAVHTSAKYGLAVAAFIGFFFFFFPKDLLGLFGMTDAAVLEIGTELLRVLGISGLFIVVALAYNGGLQGTGDTKGPMYISMISQLFLPLAICSVVTLFWKLEAIHIWIAILAGHISRCLLGIWRFNQGKWRSIEIDRTIG
jgi:putative MATE family efflux protein